MFNRILISTDGSNAVKPAVEKALKLAEIHGAILHALFVVEEPTVSGVGEGYAGIDAYLEELEEEGVSVTEAIVEQAEDKNIKAESVVLVGDPSDEILAYATDNDIDLIVLGTHGRTGVKRAVLGSVTEDVVRHSEIPVLSVHREPEQ